MTRATTTPASSSRVESLTLGWWSHVRGPVGAALAVGSAVAAWAILGSARVQGSAYLWLVPAIAFAAMRFGTTPGLVACALSVGLMLVRSATTGDGVARGDVADSVVFVAASLLVVNWAARLRRAREAEVIQQDRSDRTYHATLRLEDELGNVRAEKAELVKRAEEAAEEARQATRVQEQLLHAVSHDLRSPLVSILGFSDALVECPDDGQLRARAVEAIARNARRQKELLDELLDASRIVSGKARIALDRVDLVRVAHAAAGRATAGRSRHVRIELVPSDPGDAELAVRGDTQRLERAVATLITNAMHTAPSDGAVSVAVTRQGPSVELAIETTDGEATAPGRELPPHAGLGSPGRDPAGAATDASGGFAFATLRRLIELHRGELVDGVAEAGGRSVVLRLPACEHEGHDAGQPPPVSPDRLSSEPYHEHGA